MSRRLGLPLGAALAASLLLMACGSGHETERLQKLVGAWLRPDGGYVLTIQSIDDNGKVTASYANPSPIRVHQAKATINDRDELILFVELRDANYPGSIYTLRYNAETDRLEGDYYQAAMRQHFPVAFVRRP